MDVVLDRVGERDAGQVPFRDQIVERLEREVRIDDARAEPEQERAMMHLARVARLHDQPASGARAAPDEMLVNRRRREQARDRRAIAIGPAVREDHDGVARGDRVAGTLLQLLDRA